MTTFRRNLIIGAAIGYRVEQVEPFLESLWRTPYRGDVVLLVDRRLARLLRASRWGSRLAALPIAPQWLPLRLGLFDGGRRGLLRLWAVARAVLWLLLRLIALLPHSATRRSLDQAVVDRLHPPVSTRFLHYRRFIAAGDYTHVLMTDVRDVVFQEDPFAQLPERGLAVSIEKRGPTLGSEPVNSHWLRLAYGDAVVRELEDRPVSCAGVTYGDRAAVLRYLDAMAEAIIAAPYRATALPGFDQAVHNVLVWRGALSPLVYLETLHSAVATLHGVALTDLGFDERGRVLNQDRSPVCLLHMYDRVAGLRERLLPLISPT